MSNFLSSHESEERSIKKIGGKIISFSNAALPTISILIIAAIIFQQFGAYAWGTFVSEFLWLSIAAKVVNYGAKEFILSTAGDDSEETAEKINESINAGMIFIPAFFLIFLVLPFGITHVLWLTIWLSIRYIYQSYEPFYTLYQKQGNQLLGELAASIFIISILLIQSESFSVVYLLQLFSTAELIKTIIANLQFRNTLTIGFHVSIKSTYLKNKFLPFAIILSVLLKTRLDQLIATFCLPTESIAAYQILMTLMLFSQSILYSLSLEKISKLYTLTYDYISEVSNKIILRGIIPVTALALAIPIAGYYIYAYQAENSIMIALFLILLSNIYSLSYVYALYKAKEEQSVMQINLIVIVLTAIAMPYIMLHYAMNGAFIFSAFIYALQALLLKLRVRKLL